MLPIIVFAGRAGAGKSTIASAVADKFAAIGCQATIGSFAGPLKRMCVEAFDLPEEAVYGPSEARGARVAAPQLASRLANEVSEKWCRALFPTDPAQARERWREVVGMLIATPDEVTVRKILQFFGTEWGRWLDDTVWARAEAAAAVEHVEKTSLPWLIADCRFANEVWAVRRAGGVAVRITRPYLSNLPADAHASERWVAEAPLTAFDLEVDNCLKLDVVAQGFWEDLARKFLPRGAL